MKLLKDQLKVFGDQKVLVTEVNKPKLDLERRAKLGTNKLHISTIITKTRNLDLVKKLTTAEIQMVVTPSGVILLILPKDGNTVIQSILREKQHQEA